MLVGSPESDVGAAPGHLCRDCDGSELACPGDHGGFVGIVSGVEHSGWDACFGEGSGEALGLGDALRADQDRLTGVVTITDLGHDGVQTGLVVEEHSWRVIDPLVR